MRCGAAGAGGETFERLLSGGGEEEVADENAVVGAALDPKVYERDFGCGETALALGGHVVVVVVGQKHAA